MRTTSSAQPPYFTGHVATDPINAQTLMGMAVQVILRLDDQDLITFAEKAFRVGRPAQFSEVNCGDQARLIIDIDATAELRSRSQAGFAVWKQSQSSSFSDPVTLKKAVDTHLLAF